MRILSKVLQEYQSYRNKPKIDLSLSHTDPEHALIRTLLFYLLPLWTTAGTVDWYWHRKTDIEHTAGLQESLIHLAMFTEAGAPLLMGLFFEINAGLLALMLSSLAVHEATAIWDVAYASEHRAVLPREQHTHSFLEVLPFTAFALASALHWDQLQSLLGIGNTPRVWKIRPKRRRLPTAYLGAVAALMIVGIALPYGNELSRCWKAARPAK